MPSPSAPISWPAGTRTSSKATIAWRVLVHDEHRVLAVVLAAGELRLEEDVVGGVVRRHVHLLAAQDVVGPIASSRRRDGVDVGARALLGDRVALPPLAADRGLEPAIDLLVGHHLGGPPRRGVHAP